MADKHTGRSLERGSAASPQSPALRDDHHGARQPASVDDEPLFSLEPLLDWFWFSLGSLRRHRLVAVVVALCAVLLGGILIAGEAPSYQATVTVLLRTEGAVSDSGTMLTLDQASRQANGVVTRRDSLDTMIDEVDLLGDEVRKPVFGRLGDAVVDLFGTPSEAKRREDLRRDLRKSLTAEPSSFGESILITVTWGDATQAKQIADIAYRVFFEDREVAEITPKQETVRLLTSQTEAASAAVATLRSELGIGPLQDAPQGSDLLTAIGVERDLKDKLQAAELELQSAEEGLRYQYALLQPAEVPLKPVSGNLTNYATLAALVALCTVGACLALDRRRALVLEEWQLRRRRLRVLAAVSGAPSDQSGAARAELPVPHSASNADLPVVVVHEYTPQRDYGPARDRDLEQLWFSLCEPTFVPVTLVPVPGTTGADVVELAGRLAAVGAWISGEPAVVIDALTLVPPDVDAAAAVLEQHIEAHPHLLLVVEAPTVEPTTVPILRVSRRIVLVVGVGASRTNEIAAMEPFIEPGEIFGVVSVEPST